MRYCAPDRECLDALIWQHPVFTYLNHRHLALCRILEWPEVDSLNGLWQAPLNSNGQNYRFVAQEVLADSLHYEQRIFEFGDIPTRSRNWHDLFNAFIWMTFPNIKAALNTRQVHDINAVGAKQRTRAQCAMTHFDEAGAIIRLSDAGMLESWSQHDWPSLFDAWQDAVAAGKLQLWLFGHTQYEHALNPDIALVAKALVIQSDQPYSDAMMDEFIAQAIIDKHCMNDPQELRPIPLSGIPGWHELSGQADFYQRVPCFRPKRVGKIYPEPLRA